MIVPAPLWTYAPDQPSPAWGAEVHLLPEHVVGVLNGRRWFCLRRSSGQPVWERRLGRPNTLCGLAGEVLVAAEHRANDGPWAADFGVYGISLAEGRLLWTSHAPGGWGRLLRLLDFVPDFTNEFRDAPLRVEGHQILTFRGRQLDPLTGRDLGRQELDAALALESKPFSTRLLAWKEVPLPDLGTLVAGRPGEPEEPGVVEDNPLRFYLRSPDGQVAWEFDAAREERIGEPHYWGLSFGYSHPFLYLAAADRPDNAEGEGAIFRLLTFDLRTGSIVQDLPLGSEVLSWCHVEACDSNSVLVGSPSPAGKYQLTHFARDTTAGT